jgi:Leucine-rich repeat (LRR) protein
MKKTIIILLVIGSSLVGFGQQNKYYSSLEEIDNAVPDSVYRISIDCKKQPAPDFSNYSTFKNLMSIELLNFGGTSIPDWLFKFENIKVLSFEGSIFYKSSGGYTSPLNNLNGISKFKHLEKLSIGWTSVSELPDEILENQKLVFLFIAGSKISTLTKINEWTKKYKKSIGLEWYYEQFSSKEDKKALKKFASGSTSSQGAIPKTSHRTFYYSF